MEINYDNFSLSDLKKSAQQIDREKFPEKYQTICAAIERKENEEREQKRESVPPHVPLGCTLVTLACLYLMASNQATVVLIVAVVQLVAGISLILRKEWAVILSLFALLPFALELEFGNSLIYSIQPKLAFSVWLGFDPIHVGFSTITCGVLISWAYLAYCIKAQRKGSNQAVRDNG
ncbi:hypothetical protein [Coraliomargarita akajimensis]|uniref:Uncharacterized protein n=1 Tax=Coraliomargarita akajimensis (strain DSM 45221 / IAM 15411 / JCM 23193 / KCTC 12865 / 04OKA010-24) TaxID=583355 RepID=D5EMC3_CORAD|nr:hypothetical protein [Coraliomargarita akajimensis]ADE53329.1 hypothetical protein Caka_0303 [Coraliomargarita akajimensis DSM 45221]